MQELQDFMERYPVSRVLRANDRTYEVDKRKRRHCDQESTHDKSHVAMECAFSGPAAKAL